MAMKDNSVLTVQEVARILRRTERTVRRNISDGYLRGYRSGKKVLIQKQDLREYIGCRAVR